MFKIYNSSLSLFVLQNALLPAGFRQKDQTVKKPSGSFNREKLLAYLEKQALEHKDREDVVPFTGEKKGNSLCEYLSLPPSRPMKSSKPSVARSVGLYAHFRFVNNYIGVWHVIAAQAKVELCWTPFPFHACLAGSQPRLSTQLIEFLKQWNPLVIQK